MGVILRDKAVVGEEVDKFGRGIKMEVKEKKESWKLGSLVEGEGAQRGEQRREDPIYGQ